MTYGFEVDAADVLGVSPQATLREIHDAYRARAKKHHPDMGGEDWAFRAVARAYEILSQARLKTRISGEWPWSEAPTPEPPTARTSPRANPQPTTPPPPPTPPPTPPTPPPPRQPDPEPTRVRAGVEDPARDPTRVVGVEIFTIRYEMHGAIGLLADPKDRNLSSCLNISWPPPPLHDDEPRVEGDARTLDRVVKAFAKIPKKTRATASWSRAEENQFVGWMSYPTASQAFEAFEIFHRALNEQGLAARQTSRELFVARGRS